MLHRNALFAGFRRGPSATGAAGAADRDRGRRDEGLEDDAVALGELDQRVELLLVGRLSRSKRSRMAVKPTGASRSTASVPLKSRSPSATTVPAATGISSDVATERSVTPAHAASASSSMSPEHSCVPSPPVAGCSPASAIARPVVTEHDTPSPSAPDAVSVMRAAPGSSR